VQARMSTGRRNFLLSTLAALRPPASRAQVTTVPRPKLGTPQEPKRTPNIRTDINLVLVPVTVCDPQNHPVTGLEKEHFKVFDDKVEQTITQFAMDDEPVAVRGIAGRVGWDRDHGQVEWDGWVAIRFAS